MKSLPCLLISLFLTVCLSAVSAEPSNVPFTIGKQEFKSGDGIVIERVLATSSALKVGDKVIVRGHFKWEGAPQANLGLFATHRTHASADPAARSQTMRVARARGTFDLSGEIIYEGDIHVSFYPVTGGEAFGGVYFTVGPQDL